MTAAENKALVKRYFNELWNRGDTEVANQIIAPDYRSAKGCLPGREAVKLYIRSYREAYPLTRFTILSMVAQGDMVTVCWASKGTHKSICQGACSDRPASTGTSVFRIEEGQIVESWVECESAGRFQRSAATPELN
jgi:predicted SnoaL-like aldol condensation-catalyzing enzyme